MTATAVEVHPGAQKFASERGKLLIAGRWVDAASGETFPTLDPSTGEEITQIAAGTKEDVDRAAALDSGGPAGAR